MKKLNRGDTESVKNWILHQLDRYPGILTIRLYKKSAYIGEVDQALKELRDEKLIYATNRRWFLRASA